MKRGRRHVAGVTVAGCLALAGCMVGPDYHKPQTNPQPIRLQSVETPEADSAGIESGVPVAKAWWRTLGDDTLIALIDSAVDANLDLKTAIARVRESRAQRAVAVGPLYPSLSLSSGQGAGFAGPANAGASGSGDKFHSSLSYGVGLSASWEIDVWGSTRRNIEAADANLGVAVETRREVLVTLLAQVGTAYVDLRSEQRQVEIAKTNIDLEEKTLDLAQIKQRAGLNSDLDVAQAKTQLETTRATVPLLEELIAKNIYTLGTLLGRPPSALWSELSTPAPMPGTPVKVPVGLPHELLLRRPDIREAERTMAAACANVGVEEAALYPSFSLAASVGYAPAADYLAAGTPVFFVGPTVSWPLFNGFATVENVKVMDARLEEAVLAFRSAILTALLDVETQVSNYSRELVRKGVLVQAEADAKEAESCAEVQYKNGLVDFLNVITAEGTLATVQNTLAQSEQSVLEDLVAVYKALGGGWNVYEDGLHERESKDAETELPR